MIASLSESDAMHDAPFKNLNRHWGVDHNGGSSRGAMQHSTYWVV
ncbi:MAG: hypothetical protein OXB92_09215 [Acidimicrobiaceae bacterium]|nr:hypothetical protein [Acidimicrobiaceae bacterium]